jgi:hypothetical protein
MPRLVHKVGYVLLSGLTWIWIVECKTSAGGANNKASDDASISDSSAADGGDGKDIDADDANDVDAPEDAIGDAIAEDVEDADAYMDAAPDEFAEAEADAPDAGLTPTISEVAPATNVAGGALLVVGTHLENASVFVGGLKATIISLDTSVPSAEKLVAAVPDSLPQGSNPVMVTSSTGLASASTPFLVARTAATEAVVGPASAYGIITQSAYPPLENSWYNECSAADSYFVNADSDPHDLGASGGIRTFAGTHTLGDGLGDTLASGPISGYFDETTWLFFMTVEDFGLDPVSYVGAFSYTASPMAFRLVLFPQTIASPQLILFTCPGPNATDWTGCQSADGGLPSAGPDSCP